MPITKRYERKQKPTADNSAKKRREVRDLYNKLRSKHTATYVLEFFQNNYFLSENAIHDALRKCDNKPVDHATASIQYLTAIHPDFKL